MAFDERTLPSPMIMGIAPIRMHLEDGDWVDLKWNGHDLTVTDVKRLGPDDYEGIRSPVHHTQDPQDYDGLPGVGSKIQFNERHIFLIQPRT